MTSSNPASSSIPFLAPRALRAARRHWLKFVTGLLLLLAALVFTAYFFPQQVLTIDSGDVHADALIVLGGGGRERPERAAELFQGGAAPLIICSGIGDDEINEAWLTNRGVPLTDIRLEPNSRTTQENAKNSITLLHTLGAHRVIIVTTWYHSRRALACFEHYAPDLQFYSRPSYFGYPKTEWNHQGIHGYIRAEYVKMLYYWVSYGVCPL
jgi:uncharacterized SAM-binding protein YcdF (DUF218 family)